MLHQLNLVIELHYYHIIQFNKVYSNELKIRIREKCDVKNYGC
jgi:hypothetical protein